jgi:hypothetical protein
MLANSPVLQILGRNKRSVSVSHCCNRPSLKKFALKCSAIPVEIPGVRARVPISASSESMIRAIDTGAERFRHDSGHD